MSVPGGPWHCGNPMRMGGGYQCGGGPPNGSWMGWRCEQCGHQEVVFGKLHWNKNNSFQKFEPFERRIMTVLMHNHAGGVLCRGLSQDETIFEHATYRTTDEAVDHLGRFYSARGYRVVFDLPPKEKAS